MKSAEAFARLQQRITGYREDMIAMQRGGPPGGGGPG